MRWAVLPLTLVTVAGVAVTAAAARTNVRPALVVTTGPTAPLATGISGSSFRGSEATTAYALASQAGATYARTFVSWGSIAPKTLPASGFDPTDPTSPYYDWSSLDATVSAAQAAGVTPILDIVAPPQWAYNVQPEAWTGGSPRIGDLRAFATALAKHYDGSGPAPKAGVFSVWNEPNFNKNLYPQSASLYRSMVNAVASAVHAVDPTNLVLAGELAPFRHTPSTRDRNHVIPPMTFMRSMLCVSASEPAHRTCDTQAKFDVWAHHPYSSTGPYGKAKSKGGVELGDLPKMEAVLQAAEQLGTIASAQPVQFWVTEFGWSSNPPNKNGVPINLETRWLAESMYQIWKSGASVAIWFQLQDGPKSSPFQSGLYLRSPSLAGAPAKPLLTAFRFPFVAYVKKPGKIQIWGLVTTGGMQDVTIEQRNRLAGRWKPAATIESNSQGIFTATLSLNVDRRYSLRAYAPGPGYSGAFSLEVPHNENMNVTPFPRG